MWNFPLFPDQASTSATRVDALYYMLLAVSGFFGLLIVILLSLFAIRYYHRKEVNRRIVRKDYLKLELAWTLVPFGISMVIFTWGAKLYYDLQTPPSDASEVYVVGR